eukprot:6475078-Amphidinium_carterae.4
MYTGRRRILIQGAVSDPVQATHGMPPGCGHAVDLLHAFLIKTTQSAGPKVEARKYVDDCPTTWSWWSKDPTLQCISARLIGGCIAVLHRLTRR